MPVASVAGAVKHHHEHQHSPCSNPHSDAALQMMDSSLASADPNRSASRTLGEIHLYQMKRGQTSSLDPAKPAHWLIDNHFFEVGVSFVAVLNAIFIGMSYDHTSGVWPRVWDVSEQVFTAIFLAEMVLKLMILRIEYFRDRWNLLDFALVIPAVIENWILSWVLSGEGGLSQFTILRIFRLARFVRMFRLAKTMKDLANLIEALLYSLKTMAWAYMLLMVMVYMYALVCVEFIGADESYPGRAEDNAVMTAAGDHFNNYQFFGTVSRSMYSLFCIITLSEFSTTTRPIFERQPAMVVVLITFTCLSAFGIMNVVIGLMVQQALDVSSSLAEQKDKEAVRLKMQRIQMIKDFLNKESMHVDEDEDISLEELSDSMIAHPELVELMMQIDLPPNITVQEIFSMIDVSGDGKVSPTEFVSQLSRLIDCTPFQQLCLMQISMNDMKRSVMEVRSNLSSLTQLIDSTKACIKIEQESSVLNNPTERLVDAISELKEDLKKEMEKHRDEVLDLIRQAPLLNEINAQQIAIQSVNDAVDSAMLLRPVIGIEAQGWEQLPSPNKVVSLRGKTASPAKPCGSSSPVLDWQRGSGLDVSSGRPMELAPGGKVLQRDSFLSSCSMCRRSDYNNSSIDQCVEVPPLHDGSADT